jgi:hypothetical protein
LAKIGCLLLLQSASLFLHFPSWRSKRYTLARLEGL